MLEIREGPIWTPEGLHCSPPLHLRCSHQTLHIVIGWSSICSRFCIVTSRYFATFHPHTCRKLLLGTPILSQELRAFFLNMYRIHLGRRRGNDVSSLWCETCNHSMRMSLYQHPLSSMMDVQHPWSFLVASPLLVPVYSRNCVTLLQPCGRAGHPCLIVGRRLPPVHHLKH